MRIVSPSWDGCAEGIHGEFHTSIRFYRFSGCMVGGWQCLLVGGLKAIWNSFVLMQGPSIYMKHTSGPIELYSKLLNGGNIGDLRAGYYWGHSGGY